MESELKKKFDALLRLQENEIETETIQSRLDELPRKRAALEATANEGENNVGDASARLNDLQQTFRSQESEAKSVQASITKSEDKLRSVKTNKEYQSSLKEIEDLAATLSSIEDRMIACLEEIDKMEDTVTEKKVELTRIVREIGDQKEQLQQSADEMQQRITDLGKERDHIIGVTDSELFNLYEIVKKNIGSVAIALVRNAVCMQCHVNLPPQMFNELLRFEKVFYCPHCDRLIFPVTD